jgi:hypothetical protein
VQAKLVVNAPGDPLEREADRVADAVVAEGSVGVGVSSSGGSFPAVQRRCAACEDESTVMREAPASTPSGPLSAPTTAKLDAVRGGAPLPLPHRHYFEHRLGADLTGVRVHTGPAAEEAASALGAQAFAFGSDIVFGPGRYEPGTSSGRWLIAHELAHVIQQGGARQAVQRHPDGAAVRERQLHRGPARTCVVGPGPFPGDGLAPPGDCSWAEYVPLLAVKESAAMIVSGLGSCGVGDSCSTLALKIAAISAEIAARLAREAKCFRGGDRGHRVQICDKVNMMMRCYRHFGTQGCPQELVGAMEVVVATMQATILAAGAALTVALVAALVYAIIALLEVIIATLAAAAAAAAEALLAALAALLLALA